MPFWTTKQRLVLDWVRLRRLVDDLTCEIGPEPLRHRWRTIDGGPGVNHRRRPRAALLRGWFLPYHAYLVASLELVPARYAFQAFADTAQHTMRRAGATVHAVEHLHPVEPGCTPHQRVLGTWPWCEVTVILDPHERSVFVDAATTVRWRAGRELQLSDVEAEFDVGTGRRLRR